ncbi:MAG: UDP-N-acetylmuramoyl-L-alanyl-D-glutamate--2,6-diaminopimelate ligase [Bacteriovorax sp.]|jgi:UDP-N-acetylmuramoyl-L-alanyl-D-glutamate--2,6-diaminopimelate ligase|nr:UDP-N-acetylmuramoyl-L-alanyl-D-glutamate--2,6-diaminopimelate ligase [Bacteriovorax sp.]
MNKEKILSLIKDSTVSSNIINELTADLKNITTNLQDAKREDIVFYKIEKSHSKSEENFNKRMMGAKPGLLVLNEEAQESIKSDNTIFIKHADFLRIQKILLDELFPNKQIMKMVGITGTNGKTTTVNLAMQIASMSGHPSISIGTIGVQDMNGSLISDIESTTPSYAELRKLIYRFQDTYEVCFIEVSSHALSQNRLFDIKLDCAGWTSFSQDHLDYHRTMDEYFKAKLLIEEKFLKKNASLLMPAQETGLWNKIKAEAPLAKIKMAKTLDQRNFGQSLEERPLFYHSSYNQSNVEIALQVNEELFGLECLRKIQLKEIKTPLGRFSVIELQNESMAIIDYAHTPDALVNIGNAIKTAFPGHSLTVVFGCGGNRDKSKRPLMGKAVSEFANKMIVTSDNPRDEAPEDIIIDILAGIKGSYEAVIDRNKAILAALESLGKKEIVLIAGKGHEEYQEIKGIKYPFSDFNIVMNFKAGK